MFAFNSSVPQQMQHAVQSQQQLVLPPQSNLPIAMQPHPVVFGSDYSAASQYPFSFNAPKTHHNLKNLSVHVPANTELNHEMYPTPSSHRTTHNKRRKIDLPSPFSSSSSCFDDTPAAFALPLTPTSPSPASTFLQFPSIDLLDNDTSVVLKTYGVHNTLVSQTHPLAHSPPTFLPEPICQEELLAPSEKLRQVIINEGKTLPLMYNVGDRIDVMRSEMIQWLIKLNHHQHFRFHPETVFLAVNYCDRYLSTHDLTKPSQYYLLGMVCLSLAAKIAEDFSDPLISDMLHFLQTWDHSINDIKNMERDLLSTLNFNLYAITPTQVLYELLRQPSVQYHIQSLFTPTKPPSISSPTSPTFLTPLQHRLPLNLPNENRWRNESWRDFEGISRTIVKILATLSEDIILKSLPDGHFSMYTPSILTLAALNLALELHANTLLAHHPQLFSHLQNTRLRILFNSQSRQPLLARCVARLRTLIR